jgi:hypothetical protein
MTRMANRETLQCYVVRRLIPADVPRWHAFECTDVFTCLHKPCSCGTFEYLDVFFTELLLISHLPRR